jgi:hypothetical protein
MIEVEMPDGTIAEFPDGTSQDVMKQALQKRFGAPKPSNPVGDAFRAAQTGAMQGMTFGFADEIAGTLMTPIQMGVDAFEGRGFDPGGSWNRAVAGNRALDKQQMDASPIAGTVGQIAGGLGTGVGLARGGLTLMNAAKPTVASMGTRGAIEAAAYGGLQGLGAGENDKLASALEGAGYGALGGGALGGVGGAIASRVAQKAVPTIQDLKAQGKALYDAARASGVTFPRSVVKTAADDIAARAISEGLDPTLHPGATAALKRLQDAAQTGMTAGNAQTMRRVIAAAAKDPMNPDQSRIASMMIDDFDDLITGSIPDLAAANAIYRRAKKGKLIETAIELAGSRAGQFTGSGFENALRTEFRGLERQIIKGQLKGISDAERDAIAKVSRGGPLENIARWVGKFAPTGAVSFGVSAGVPFAVGNAVGGPLVGAGAAGATMGAGFLGRSAATAMQRNNANAAASLMRSGGVPPQMPAAVPAALQSLIAGGSTQVPNLPQIPAPLRIFIDGANPVRPGQMPGTRY